MLIWLLVPISHLILFICRPCLHLTLIIPSTNIKWNDHFFVTIFSIQFKMAKFIISRWVFPNCVSLLLIFFPNTLHNPDYKCLLSESCLSALHNLYGEPLFFFSAVLHPLSTISHVSGWDFISLLLWENFQLHLYRKKFTILDQLRSLMKYFAYHH